MGDLPVRLGRSLQLAASAAVGAALAWAVGRRPKRAGPLGETATLAGPLDEPATLAGVLQNLSDAAAECVYVKDLDGRYLYVNRAEADVAGRTPTEMLGRTDAEVFGESGHSYMANDLLVCQRGAPMEFEETLLRDDEIRYYASLKVPFRDRSGRIAGILGFSRDVTQARTNEIRTRFEERRLAADRFRAVVDAMSDTVTILSPVRDGSGRVCDFRIEYMNEHADDAAGRPREQLLGRLQSEAYPGFRGTSAYDVMVAVAETGEPAAIEDLPHEDVIDGQPVQGWYSVRVVPFAGGLVVSSRDVSDRRRAEQELQRAYARLAAAQRLSGLGMWELSPDTGSVTFTPEMKRMVGLGPDDPVPPIDQLVERMVMPDHRQRVFDNVAAMAATGEAVAIEVEVVRTDGQQRTVQLFGARGEDGRLWGTALDVTDQRRAAEALRSTAVELERQRATVDLLQQAIAPEDPTTDGVDVCGLYLPAGSQARVGGDWYDVFEQADGRLALVVGDVAGHGLPAAATMAQLRNALRGCAEAGNEPGVVLDTLNRLLCRHAETGFATCFMAVLDLGTGRLTWSSAGHPPAVIVPKDGEARYLDDQPGPPLGIPGTSRPTRATRLEPGDLLLAYTDGLIEEPTQSIDVGLQRLLVAVAAMTDLDSSQEVCEAVAGAMFVERDRSDDVCILTVRPDPSR